jgi:hypothetical protein
MRLMADANERSAIATSLENCLCSTASGSCCWRDALVSPVLTGVFVNPGTCTKTAMRKSVAAIVSSVDDAVGGVVDALKQAAMYSNSLIVLSTDNVCERRTVVRCFEISHAHNVCPSLPSGRSYRWCRFEQHE